MSASPFSLLTGQGYPCWGVGSAEAFYKQLMHQEADIVLVDLGLPGEDGLSLAQHLRQHSACGIIIITASGGRDDRLTGLGAGADDYLVKPVDPDELHLRIDNLWQRIHNNQPSPTPALLTWHFDPSQQILTSPQGQSLLLSQHTGRSGTL
ncbi:response regulator transcription factor [Magnetovirga frankeli]|nr:response regulator transcription factor [gamma proteobacterium SS-5]